MVNQQILEGHWNEFKGQLRQHWRELTDDDFRSVDGDVDKLVGLIQRKTGESREEVEEFLDDLASAVSTATERASARGRRYVHDVAESLRETSGQVGESIRHGYTRAESLVQRRPAESLCVAFAAGLVSGIVAGLLIRSR